jgi:CDP-diacylglycerol--serine O-phosphatidyltransferase
MKTEGAMDVHMLAMCPAFLVACFGALRLARFNNAPATTHYFIGMPIPSIGIFIASFPMIYIYNPLGIGTQLQNVWVLYAIIALVCFLMVCNKKFFTIKFNSLSFQKNWIQFTWLGLSIVAVFFLKWLAIPFGFLLYICLSFLWKEDIAENK